jgi:hypothetical protein
MPIFSRALKTSSISSRGFFGSVQSLLLSQQNKKTNRESGRGFCTALGILSTPFIHVIFFSLYLNKAGST